MLYFLLSTLVLTLYIDVVLSLSIKIIYNDHTVSGCSHNAYKYGIGLVLCGNSDVTKLRYGRHVDTHYTGSYSMWGDRAI